MKPACGWLSARQIDSSTWVAGGSDSSVAVETNTANLPANQGRASAPGIHLTHAEDFLKTKTHINTHTFVSALCCCVGRASVYVLKLSRCVLSPRAVWSSFDTVSGSLT